jgi:hypothetical protein
MLELIEFRRPMLWSGPVFLLGTFAFLGGLFNLADGLRGRRRKNSVVATPLSAVAAVERSGPVAIRGRALPGEDGVLEAPASGAAVVWYRIVVERWGAAAGTNGSYSEVHTEVGGSSLVIDDGSGATARVMLENVAAVADGKRVGVGDDEAPTTTMSRFLESRGLPLCHDNGEEHRYWVTEQVIAPHEVVFVRGHGDVAGATLVVRAEPGPSGELILSKKDIATTATTLDDKLRASIVLLIAGLTLAVGAFIARSYGV